MNYDSRMSNCYKTMCIALGLASGMLCLTACDTKPQSSATETEQNFDEGDTQSIVPSGTIQGSVSQSASGGLSDEEMAIEPPRTNEFTSIDEFSFEFDDSELEAIELDNLEDEVEPVSLEQAKRPLRLEVFSDRNYQDADGRQIHDVMEADYLYLTLLIEDAEGRPVQDIKPKFQIKGDSRAVSMVGNTEGSDLAGNYPFGIVGGKMGEQEVSVQAADQNITFYLNVISLAAAGYENLADIEGALDWREMMQAKISWGEEITAVFPESIQRKNGKMVKLAGFMMPLDMAQEQAQFIMTSNPPSCFYHIPGGPAGAVHVKASPAIKLRWDPIVLEGRLVTLEKSQTGTLYQLHDAREIKP